SKPKGKQFRTQGLEHYQLLGEIFNTTTATGQLHYASSQLPPNSDNERELENNFLNTGVHIDVDLDDDGDNPHGV
ncbi:PREDICTED: L10-interacting MYB domain-containing, partial [Prunus dulcis]